MKKLIASALLAFVAAAPLAAFAQFSMPSIPGFGKSSGGGADLSGQQDALVRNFVAANKDVLNADSKMAEALGLKNEATSAQATADSLTEGATKDNLTAANKAVADTGGAVSAAIAKKPVLDAQAKATFGVGLISLVSGVTKYVGLGKNVKDIASGLSGASLMMLPKLQSAVYVVSKFPGSAADLANALQNAIAFATENDIKVPAGGADAMKALGALNG